MYRYLVYCFAVSLALVTLPVHATLIGDDVRLQRIADGVTEFDQTTTVVDPAPEFFEGIHFGAIAVDVMDSSVRFEIQFAPTVTSFTFLPPNHFYILSDLDWVGTPGSITGASLTSSGFAGLGGIAGFTADSVTIDISGANTTTSGSWFEVDLEVVHEAVPVPATPALVLLGLCALAMRRIIVRPGP